MRLWLNDSERRPDPAPARADARKALIAGTAAWLAVLVASIVFREQLESAGWAWFTWAAAIGTGLGAAGLVVVQLIRRRIARQARGPVS